MVISVEQKLARKGAVGSSDVAAIMGYNPWRSAYDVWLEKTDRLNEDDPVEKQLAVQIGNALEPIVLAYAEAELGQLRENVTMAADGSPIVCNIDAIVEATGEPVEAKTSGLMGPLAAEWGEPDTDQVPNFVIFQTHAHLMATGRDVCHVPAILGGHSHPVMYRVNRSAELCTYIREGVQEFWDKHVRGDIPPAESLPSAEMLKRVRREPNKVIDIPADLARRYLETKEAAKAAAEQESAAKRALMASLDDAEAGDCGELGQFTYYEQTRKAYEVQESTFRVLRFKKPNSGGKRG